MVGETRPNDLQARTAIWSTTLLSLVEAPITAETTHVCLDIDTFVMDNSNLNKEGVSRTYQKVDGYTPIAAYCGNEGWCWIWNCVLASSTP